MARLTNNDKGRVWKAQARGSRVQAELSSRICPNLEVGSFLHIRGNSRDGGCKVDKDERNGVSELMTSLYVLFHW